MSRLRWQSMPLALLVGIHLASLAAEFLAPNSPLDQDRALTWAPPTPLRFVDAEGRFHLRPFVYPLEPDLDALDVYHEDRTRPCFLGLLVRGDTYRFAGLFNTDLHLLGVEPPAKLLFLGTDGLGRDVAARLLAGARVSLFAGLLAAGTALLLGTVLGIVAGYYTGRTDAILMRLVELFLALPWLYLLLAVRAFLPLRLSATQAFFLLVAIIGLIGWARPARLIRGVVLSARERPYVTAARGFGATDLHLLRRHVFPQTLSVLRTQAAILTPRYVLAEVTLSFLGLGIAEPHPSWGNLLAQLQRYHILANYWWMLAPAAGLLLVFLSYFSLTASTRPSRNF